MAADKAMYCVQQAVLALPFAEQEGLLYRSPQPVACHTGALHLSGDAASLSLDGIVNAFPSGHFQRHTTLDAIQIEIDAHIEEGKLEVVFVPVEGASQTLQTVPVTHLDAVLLTEPVQLPVTAGRLFVRLTGKRTLLLRRMRWVTPQAPRRERATVIITTFEAAGAAARALGPLVEQARAADLPADFVVVDNSGSLTLADLPVGVRLISQSNLGSIGGFMRGLIDARAKGSTHVVFMHEGEFCLPDVICRALAFLLRRKTELALAGRMLLPQEPAVCCDFGALYAPEQFELTAVSPHLDLRQEESLRQAYSFVPAHAFGWQLFAAPTASAPFVFPGFIKGGDLSFSLKLEESGVPVVQLPSFFSWHQSSNARMTPWSHYYNLRNHLIVRASLSGPVIDVKHLARNILKAVLRQLAAYEYRAARMMLDGLEEFMEGPFAVRSLYEPPSEVHEKMVAQSDQLEALQNYYDPACAEAADLQPGRIAAILALLGHLLPGLGKRPRPHMRARHPGDFRWWRWCLHRRVLVWYPAEARGYIACRHGLQAMWLMLVLFMDLRTLIRRWPQLCRIWHDFDATIDATFWQDYLGQFADPQSILCDLSLRERRK